MTREKWERIRKKYRSPLTLPIMTSTGTGLGLMVYILLRKAFTNMWVNTSELYSMAFMIIFAGIFSWLMWNHYEKKIFKEVILKKILKTSNQLIHLPNSTLRAPLGR